MCSFPKRHKWEMLLNLQGNEYMQSPGRRENVRSGGRFPIFQGTVRSLLTNPSRKMTKDSRKSDPTFAQFTKAVNRLPDEDSNLEPSG